MILQSRLYCLKQKQKTALANLKTLQVVAAFQISQKTDGSAILPNDRFWQVVVCRSLRSHDEA
ncbi:hypothetical protein GCM10007895_18400 [Paraferrimonas sedimenticola]|uniref:Uncharacterized protein n=1 Tax=Paraferrimonas sedimenticola TaxID=375674 RepID=A0AA37VXG5_9GAMM|nr:hypothetical protein GCM10007895_18400 [Paraferrimonas sedimenticola]